MGGANMESLLMGDDSSSGESDNEELNRVPASASAVAAAVQPTQSPTPGQQQQQQQQPANQPPPQNPKELSQRLKDLYSPASHAKKPVQQPPQQQQQQQQQPRGPPPLTHHQHAPPQQQQQQQGAAHDQSRAGGGGIKHQVSPHEKPSQHYQHPSQQQQRQHPGQPAHHQQQPQYPTQHTQYQQHQQRPLPSPQQRASSSGSGGRSGMAQQQQSPLQRSSGSTSSQQRPSSQLPHQSQHPHQHPHQQYQQPQRPSGSVPNPVPHGAPAAALGPPHDHDDPFAPTPYHKIAAAGGNGGGGPPQPQPQQMKQPLGRTSGGAASTVGGSSGSKGGSSVSERDREMRRQKERFLMFTRVLMKYLETKDPPLHQQVKGIIKDCAERNKRNERGYESVTASMRERLKQVVGESYWKRAESYLNHFLAQKNKGSGSGGGGGSGSSGGGPGATPGGTAEAQARAAEQKKRQEMLQKQQKMQQQKMQQQQQQQQQPTTTTATTVVSPAPAALEAKAPAPATKRASSTGRGSKSTGGKKAASGKQPKEKTTTTKKRKSDASGSGRGSKSTKTEAASTAGASPAAATGSTTGRQTPNAKTAAAPPPQAEQPPPRPPSPPPVREYSQFMELVDHAIHFDWTTAGLIMGSSKQKEHLDEEQKNLLYSGTHTKHLLVRDGEEMTTAETDTTTTPTTPNELPGPEASPIPLALRGWSQRNVMSARVAWSRVRRREQPKPDEAKRNRLPIVGEQREQEETAANAPNTAWVHEEKAEEDPVLCLLSEATQIYIKQILQKALVCARRRQNLDGIRLWHQQCTAAINMKGKDAKEAEKEKPPLSIRLGCDVSRQVARTMCNAALTCKRMEEALERKPKTEERIFPSEEAHKLGEATVAAAQSMGELALVPQLSKGAEKADLEAKRSFEIYGGKFAQEPPLGRVPKKAKLEVADFQQGMQLQMIGSRGNSRRHRANPHAFYF